MGSWVGIRRGLGRVENSRHLFKPRTRCRWLDKSNPVPQLVGRSYYLAIFIHPHSQADLTVESEGGGPTEETGLRRVLRTGANLLIRLSQDPSYVGVGNCRAGFSVVRRSEREGQGGGRHTNEAAWFQLFSKLNTEGVGLYGRSREFQRYCTQGWISRQGGAERRRRERESERVETTRYHSIVS